MTSCRWASNKYNVKKTLENDICIFLFPKNVRNIGGPFLIRLLSGGKDLCIRFGGIPLLLIRDLLESVEFFSVELI